jgi:hypothetical protein
MATWKYENVSAITQVVSALEGVCLGLHDWTSNSSGAHVVLARFHASDPAGERVLPKFAAVPQFISISKSTDCIFAPLRIQLQARDVNPALLVLEHQNNFPKLLHSVS